MNRNRLKYAAPAGTVGLVLIGLGWGLGVFYLVAAGAICIAASLAYLTMPMPALF